MIEAGTWVRYRYITNRNPEHEMVFVHNSSPRVRNAVWLPSQQPCSVSHTGSGEVVPEEDVPDHLWAALAQWRLMQ